MDKKYLLVYAECGKLKFYEGQNLYLGAANLVDNIEHAAMMTLDEAEQKLDCMTFKSDWQIWSVRPGIVLDQKSERHIIRAKKAALEAELKSLSAMELQTLQNEWDARKQNVATAKQ